jgi:hypothetical protein
MSNFLFLSLFAASTFGAQDTVVPSGQIAISHSFLPGDRGSYTDLAFAPELSYFVLPNLAVGAGVSFSLASAESYVRYGWGVSPSAGYYLALGDSFGIFPRVGLNYSSNRTNLSVRSLGQSFTFNQLDFSVSAPFLFHHDHFFVGFGPLVSKTIHSKYHVEGEPVYEQEETPINIAVATTIGGWF